MADRVYTEQELSTLRNLADEGYALENKIAEIIEEDDRDGIRLVNIGDAINELIDTIEQYQSSDPSDEDSGLLSEAQIIAWKGQEFFDQLHAEYGNPLVHHYAYGEISQFEFKQWKRVRDLKESVNG